MGAIDAITHELTTGCNDPVINAGAVGELLRTLSERYAGLPLMLVLDNARSQRWVLVPPLAPELRIELLFQPAYAPNLNLIEWLGKFVKKACRSCRYFEDFARFQAALVACLEGVGGKPKGAIESLLTLKFPTFEEPQLLAA